LCVCNPKIAAASIPEAIMTRSHAQSTRNDSVSKPRELFQCLSDAEMPKRALGASVGLHGVLLMVLILVPIVLPQTLHINYRTMILVPPPKPAPQPKVEEVKLPPIRAPRLKPPEPELVVEKIPAPPKIVDRQPEPKILQPIPKPAAPALAASVAPSVVNPKPLSVPAPPPPPVVTNVFSNVASPTITATPTRNLEATGFGDTSSTTTRPTKSDTVSASGFGDAAGTREGGRPGKSGTGTVGAVGGFDVAGTGGTRTGANPGTVVAGGFATASSAPKTPAAVLKQPEPVNEKPAEILVKPRPDYTDEARKMRVEGEVLLRVLFSSSGTVRVLEVTRGLGYGLNENAIRAAEQIKFKPAQRAGQPVDSTAIVHIVFQLAY
jgi:TonB family protein